MKDEKEQVFREPEDVSPSSRESNGTLETTIKRIQAVVNSVAALRGELSRITNSILSLRMTNKVGARCFAGRPSRERISMSRI